MIAEQYDFSIDTMEVLEDHVHVFVEALQGRSLPICGLYMLIADFIVSII